jgi:hypothetical protein
VFGISEGLGFAVAALLLIGQVIRTAFTHDGSALATGLLGIGKVALACLLTLTLATAGLAASDSLASWIVQKSSYGSMKAIGQRLGTLLGGVSVANPAAGTGISAALLLIFGILLVIVLWFELLLRNAAIAVLIATSPIAAAGKVSETTRAWWTRLVSATIQLIILKPVIALVFAVGLSLTGKSASAESLLEGMLVLVLAVCAWPAVARFFTFANVTVAGGSGLATLLGFAAGRASGGIGGGAQPGLSRASSPGGPSSAAVNSLTGHMEQMAGHAGMQGANPYAQPAGTPAAPRPPASATPGHLRSSPPSRRRIQVLRRRPRLT